MADQRLRSVTTGVAGDRSQDIHKVLVVLTHSHQSPHRPKLFPELALLLAAAAAGFLGAGQSVRTMAGLG
jgi:hypothetical protein